MQVYTDNVWYWIGFLGFVAVMLALDLGVLNRKAHIVSLKEAALMSATWIGIALLFGLLIYSLFGVRQTIQYYTGWVLEESLSVDNLFVFVLIFSFFRVPSQYHHRVLFWGILCAIVMRCILILIGATLIHQFSWIIFVFGVFLIYTGIKLARAKDDDQVDIERNPLLRLARRLIPITPDYHGERFFIHRASRLLATPLLVVLLVVESTDLMFAVDSIPAVIAVTREPFIIFTSNVMAILGLRALYFVLASAVDKFYYLQSALAVILTFVGVKMIAEQLIHPPQELETLIIVGSLVFILVALTIAIIASAIRARGRSPFGFFVSSCSNRRP
jgi:tellurite resistance protein TerC